MDIASMSMAMSQANIQMSVSTALMGKIMDSQATQMNTLLQGFESANPVAAPSFGELDCFA